MKPTPEERACADGIRDSIRFMSEGRYPKPRNRAWLWFVVAGYVTLIGLLVAAVYAGSRMPVP